MGLIQLILILAVIGVLVYLIVTYVPMPAEFKKMIIAVAIVGVVLWLLFGVFHLGSYDVPVGR